MDLGCLDLCCVSVSDKQGTEATLASSESREDSMSETATASSKIGKVRFFFFFLSFSISRKFKCLFLSRFWFLFLFLDFHLRFCLDLEWIQIYTYIHYIGWNLVSLKFSPKITVLDCVGLSLLFLYGFHGIQFISIWFFLWLYNQISIFQCSRCFFHILYWI